MSEKTVGTKAPAEYFTRENASFCARISHDLRQPLQALKIFIALLKEENLTSSQRGLLQKIEDSANNLGRWLDNLLETSRIESGVVSRRNKRFRLDVFFNRLGAEYKEVAAEKNMELIFSGCRINVTTDEVLLERIIRNLLENALKYGGGKIRLHWYRCGRIVRIYIRDDGAGFNREARKNLFKAFAQNIRHRRFGSGLGLAIVKELSDILRIKIKVRSKSGRGTLFVLSLPCS